MFINRNKFLLRKKNLILKIVYFTPPACSHSLTFVTHIVTVQIWLKNKMEVKSFIDVTILRIVLPPLYNYMASIFNDTLPCYNVAMLYIYFF